MRNGTPPTVQVQGARREQEGKLTLDSILPHLRRARRLNSGQYLACCPAHDDSEPSLSLTETPDGNLLVHCHAGCPQETVLQALRRLAGVDAPRLAPTTGLTVQQYADAKRLPVERLQQWGVSDAVYQGRPALRIEYRDRDDHLIAVQYRLALSGDRFRWKAGDAPKLYGLWRLPEYSGKNLWVVEGASDCHTLWSAGIPAIAFPSASAKELASDFWNHAEVFGHIYLCLDADGAGIELLQSVAHACPLTLRERVSVVRLPDGVKDVSALWLRLNADMNAFRAQLSQAERTPLSAFTPATPAAEPAAREPSLRLTPLAYAQLEPQNADMLVPNLIYSGGITWLAGESGVGKTTFMLELIDALERGGLLWGRVPTTPTRVLWLDYDHAFVSLKEVVESYYGARERDILTLPHEQLFPLTWETLPAYRELVQREGIDLIVADTAFDWLAVLDDCNDAEAREKMTLLRTLTEETGVAIVLIHHPNKTLEQGNSTRALSGHHRWAAKADVVAFLAFDSREGRDVVRLRIAKDRYGERREYRFERVNRRFIPLEPESLPPSDWKAVEAFLQQAGEATYEAILEALQQAGFRLTLRALQQRIARWKRKGKVVVERHGFPAVAYVKLNAVGVILPESQFTRAESNPPIGEQTEQTEQTGATERFAHAPCTCAATEPTGARVCEEGSTQFTQFAQFTRVSEAHVQTEPSTQFAQFAQFTRAFGAGESPEQTGEPNTDVCPESPSREDSAVALCGRAKVETRLRELLHAPVFPLEPAEAEQVLELWQLAEAYGFPCVEVPEYAVIEAGVDSWTEALMAMAGTPAVALTREALQQRRFGFHSARARAEGTQASLFAGGMPPA